MTESYRKESIEVIVSSYDTDKERDAFLQGVSFADDNPKSHYNISNVDLVRAQIQQILSDAERMTTGNFAHHINSIKLMARMALSEFEEIE